MAFSPLQFFLAIAAKVRTPAFSEFQKKSARKKAESEFNALKPCPRSTYIVFKKGARDGN